MEVEGFTSFSKISASPLSLDCRSISGWVIFTEIFKVQRSVDIQTVTFTNKT